MKIHLQSELMFHQDLIPKCINTGCQEEEGMVEKLLVINHLHYLCFKYFIQFNKLFYN